MYKLAFLLSIYRFISHHLSHPLQVLLLLYQINRFLFAQLNDTEVICRFTPPTFPQPPVANQGGVWGGGAAVGGGGCRGEGLNIADDFYIFRCARLSTAALKSLVPAGPGGARDRLCEEPRGDICEPLRRGHGDREHARGLQV